MPQCSRVIRSPGNFGGLASESLHLNGVKRSRVRTVSLQRATCERVMSTANIIVQCYMRIPLNELLFGQAAVSLLLSTPSVTLRFKPISGTSGRRRSSRCIVVELTGICYLRLAAQAVAVSRDSRAGLKSERCATGTLGERRGKKTQRRVKL